MNGNVLPEGANQTNECFDVIMAEAVPSAHLDIPTA
jgi:hypothetical protein